MPVGPDNRDVLADYESLLSVVAEELKLPLTRIARQVELVELGEPAELALAGVRLSASSALELIDGYLLGLALAASQQSLPLEPVSTTSIVYDVARQLAPTARYYEVDLVVEASGALAPVMANAAGLKAALMSLGTAMIEAQPPAKQPPVLTIAVRRGRQGILTGWYADGPAISAVELQAATARPNARRSPLKHFSAGSAAGILVAQNILKAMSSGLNTARYHKQSGLAAVLQPSRQLSLV